MVREAVAAKAVEVVKGVAVVKAAEVPDRDEVADGVWGAVDEPLVQGAIVSVLTAGRLFLISRVSPVSRWTVQNVARR